MNQNKPTKIELDQLFRYDPESGELIKDKDLEIAGNLSDGYYKVWVGKKKYMVHHIIWCMYYGYWPTKQIDHKDRDRSNNKITNLREATPIQNATNSGVKSNSITGYKGISPNGNLWSARITVNGERVYIGTFKTPEEARTAYKEYADKYIDPEFAAY